MNMPKFLARAGLLLGSVILIACRSQQVVEEPPTNQIVENWVMSPFIAAGIADTECIVAYPDADETALKTAANTNATVGLTEKIWQKIELLDVNYNRLVDLQQAPARAKSFGEVAQRFVKIYSLTAVMQHEGFAKLPPEDKSNYCVMMALEPQQTKQLFNDLIASGGQTLGEAHKADLFERFTE